MCRSIKWSFTGLLFLSSETETQQLLHAPSCCLLSLSLYYWSSLCRLQLLPLSLSLSQCLSMSLAPSPHTGSSVGGEQREGGASWASAHRLCFCIPLPPPLRPLPWRLCSLNQTSLCPLFILVFWNVEQFSPRFLSFCFFYVFFLSSVNQRAAGWGHQTAAILRNM